MRRDLFLKKAVIVGLVLAVYTVIVVVVVLMSPDLYLQFTDLSPTTERTSIDIPSSGEIVELQSELSSGGEYSVSEYDWTAWKEQWEASGGTLIKMDNWYEFKESLKQNSFVSSLMLDEEHRVIWYSQSSTAVIYLGY